MGHHNIKMYRARGSKLPGIIWLVSLNCYLYNWNNGVYFRWTVYATKNANISLSYNYVVNFVEKQFGLKAFREFPHNYTFDTMKRPYETYKETSNQDSES